jgi:hypothetical protein
MADPRTYTGGCHCGAVRFEVKTDLSSVLACNCSICSKTGWLLAFAPEEQLTVLSGCEALSDYQFGRKRAHHLFCRTCGVRSFSRGTAPDGREMCAVNVRCLDGVDVAALTIRPFDGKSL